jgi:hypothetical protein
MTTTYKLPGGENLVLHAGGPKVIPSTWDKTQAHKREDGKYWVFQAGEWRVATEAGLNACCCAAGCSLIHYKAFFNSSYVSGYVPSLNPNAAPEFEYGVDGNGWFARVVARNEDDDYEFFDESKALYGTNFYWGAITAKIEGDYGSIEPGSLNGLDFIKVTPGSITGLFAQENIGVKWYIWGSGGGLAIYITYDGSDPDENNQYSANICFEDTNDNRVIAFFSTRDISTNSWESVTWGNGYITAAGWLRPYDGNAYQICARWDVNMPESLKQVALSTAYDPTVKYRGPAGTYSLTGTGMAGSIIIEELTPYLHEEYSGYGEEVNMYWEDANDHSKGVHITWDYSATCEGGLIGETVKCFGDSTQIEIYDPCYPDTPWILRVDWR